VTPTRALRYVTDRCDVPGHRAPTARRRADHDRVVHAGAHRERAGAGARGDGRRARELGRPDRAVLEPPRDPSAQLDRVAGRLGLVVRTEEDEAFVDEHYDQLREVYLRGGNAVPFSRRRVHQCFVHMKQARRLIAVSVRMPDGTCIATGTFFIDDRELHLWMWAHRTRYRWYRPTELMTWTVMQRALQAGCVTFDLNGE